MKEEQNQEYRVLCTFDGSNRTVWKVIGDDSFRVIASSEQVARLVADALNQHVILKQSLEEAHGKLLSLQRENMQLMFELSGTIGSMGESLLDQRKRVL